MKKVRVLFAYDLGGSINDVQQAMHLVASAYLDASFDSFALRSFNLSYLSRHDPVLSFAAEPVHISFGGDDFRANRRCFIYPWLGILHIEMDFDFSDAGISMSTLDFYDHLIAWKNSDYLPYLARSGAMNESLRIVTNFEDGESRTFAGPLAEICESLGVLLKQQINPRPERYPFHDLRIVLITDEPTATDPDSLANLLDLAPSKTQAPGTDSREYLRGSIAGTHISSSGWVSAVITSSGNESDSDDEITMVIRLIHAQWFVCQAWVHILSQEIAYEAVDLSQKRLYELARYRGQFDADLVEVGNIDLMLKDPQLIRASEIFAEAFNLEKHKNSAITRFESVSVAESKRIEEQRTREAQRLQLLFSISAAVAIAGLIPVLAQTDTPLAVFTLVIVILLGIGFMVNVALVFKKIFRMRARPTKKIRSKQFIDRAGG